jgi:three-Cys-motif partner protein
MVGRNFKSLRFPLWTQNKAKLIQTYLQLFVYITHHGTYIDGFAAPQSDMHQDTWAAKLVLEMEPKWFRDFWLCDIKPGGVEKLKQLRDTHATAKRQVTVLEGDFKWTPFVGPRTVGIKVESRLLFPFSSSSKSL